MNLEVYKIEHDQYGIKPKCCYTNTTTTSTITKGVQETVNTIMVGSKQVVLPDLVLDSQVVLLDFVFPDLVLDWVVSCVSGINSLQVTLFCPFI